MKGLCAGGLTQKQESRASAGRRRITLISKKSEVCPRGILVKDFRDAST
jgi:hypothetical protein